MNADIAESIRIVENYVEQITGTRPTPREVADALRRYFVLKEITDHIEMERRESEA